MTKMVVAFVCVLVSACGDSGAMMTDMDATMDAATSDGATDAAADAGVCPYDAATSDEVCAMYCVIEMSCPVGDPEPCATRCEARSAALGEADRRAVRACMLALVSPFECADVEACWASEACP